MGFFLPNWFVEELVCYEHFEHVGISYIFVQMTYHIVDIEKALTFHEQNLCDVEVQVYFYKLSCILDIGLENYFCEKYTSK